MGPGGGVECEKGCGMVYTASGLPLHWLAQSEGTAGSWDHAAELSRLLLSLPDACDGAKGAGRGGKGARPHLAAPGPLQAMWRDKHPFSSEWVESHVRLVCFSSDYRAPLRHTQGALMPARCSARTREVLFYAHSLGSRAPERARTKST